MGTKKDNPEAIKQKQEETMRRKERVRKNSVRKQNKKLLTWSRETACRVIVCPTQRESQGTQSQDPRKAKVKAKVKAKARPIQKTGNYDTAENQQDTKEKRQRSSKKQQKKQQSVILCYFRSNVCAKGNHGKQRHAQANPGEPRRAERSQGKQSHEPSITDELR